MTHKNNILWPCYFHLFLFTFTFYHCLAVTLLYCVTRMSANLWVVAALDFNSCSRCCMRSYMTAVICNACTVSIQPCSSLSMMSIACCCVCVGCCPLPPQQNHLNWLFLFCRPSCHPIGQLLALCLYLLSNMKWCCHHFTVLMSVCADTVPWCDCFKYSVCLWVKCYITYCCSHFSKCGYSLCGCVCCV